MTIELRVLTWTLVLALIQIILPAMLRNRETGTAYNASARDKPAAPPGVITARLFRAQHNLFETLPVFIAAVLIVHCAGREGMLSHWGVFLYFLARLVYLPLYAYGVPWLRSWVWLVSVAGIVLLLAATL